MKSTLHQSEFEALSAQLLNAIEEIRDEDSMSHHACRLLKGEIALLVKCQAGSSDKPILVAVHPKDQRTWAEECLAACRAWYQNDELPETARGFSSTGPVAAYDRQFAEAVVAYGSKRSRREGSPYELIVFRKSPSPLPYNHYHCALGAGLLMPYELIIRAMESKQKASEAQADVHLYAGLVSTKVLPNETWKDFLAKVKQEDLADREFMCSAALLWTGYAVRRADRNEEGIEPGEARDWIVAQFGDAASDALSLMGFLVDSSSAVLGEIDIRSARQLIESSHQFGMASLLLLLEDAWNRIFKAAQQATTHYEERLVQRSGRLPTGSIETAMDAKGVHGKGKPEEGYDSRSLRMDQWLARLLQLTSLIVARGLVRAASVVPEQPAPGTVTTNAVCSDSECKTHFDRDILRMYFCPASSGSPPSPEKLSLVGRRLPSTGSF